MSLVDYGHRGVPNVFLAAPLQTINAKTGTGAWNAAHFNNPQYDKLVAQYIAAVDLSTQRQHRRADRDAAAGPDADHLRVLLQLPDGDGEGRHRCLPDRDRAPVPVQRGQELDARARACADGAPPGRAPGAAGVRWPGHAAEGEGSPDGDRAATPGPRRHGHEGGHHHRDVSGGWLRPAVFGAMDGLVTNVSLIAGVGGGGGEAAHDRADRPGRPGRGRLLDGGRGVRVGLLAERAHPGRGRQGTARARAQRRRRAGRAGRHAPGTAASAPPPRGRPPRRSRRTRRRRWPCTRWRNSASTPASCPRPVVAAGASLASFAVGALIPLLAVPGRPGRARPSRSGWPPSPRWSAAAWWPG